MWKQKRRRNDFTPKPKRIVIPEYPIPTELINMFDKKPKIVYPFTSGLYQKRLDQKYEDIVKKLQNVQRSVKRLDVAQNHYFHLMKLALYLEALPNDKNIIKNEIYILDDERASDNNFQSYPSRCAHYALESMYRDNTIKYLFPPESKSIVKKKEFQYERCDFSSHSAVGLSQHENTAHVELRNEKRARIAERPKVVAGGDPAKWNAEEIDLVIQYAREFGDASNTNDQIAEKFLQKYGEGPEAKAKWVKRITNLRRTRLLERRVQELALPPRIVDPTNQDDKAGSLEQEEASATPELNGSGSVHFKDTPNYDCSERQSEYRNHNIASNAEQRQAIWNIVNKSSYPVPYILYGPPGTGKTATLVTAICQIYRDSTDRVLVCTQSNTAADEIARRLLDFLPTGAIYRLYSESKTGSSIDEKIRECSNFENDVVVLPEYEELIEKRIIITTLCNSIRLTIMQIPSHHFSYVIIDEAGQATEPDTLIPISLVSNYGCLHSQIVFAGDPQQLGPTIISRLANSILGRSILERLMSYDIYKKNINNKYNPKYITKLLENYRSHPDIIHVSNKLFYENELIAKCPRSNGEENSPRIIFHSLRLGKEEKDKRSHSVFNSAEVAKVVEYVDDLLKGKLGLGAIAAEDIGIVTPFTSQCKKIQRTLEERKIEGINVGTVELFQGQERKVMIMTTVRSKTFRCEGKEHIGHLSNPKRFNVAITRAKELLIIVGNPKILQYDKNWRYLLKFCIDKNFCRGRRFTLNNLNDDEFDDTPELVRSADLFEESPLSLFTGIDTDSHTYSDA